MGSCPQCGRNFEAHAVGGRQEGLQVGDVAVCSGYRVSLILEALPYEMRLMREQEFQALDPETRELLQRAQRLIKNG